jgi:hypothetical protein
LEVLTGHLIDAREGGYISALTGVVRLYKDGVQVCVCLRVCIYVDYVCVYACVYVCRVNDVCIYVCIYVVCMYRGGCMGVGGGGGVLIQC